MSEKHTARPWRRNDGPTHPKTEPGDIEIVENDLPGKIILTVHQQYAPVPDESGYGASVQPDDVTTNANADLVISAPTQQAEIDRLTAKIEQYGGDVNKKRNEINRLDRELTKSVNQGLADEMKALKLTAQVERLRGVAQLADDEICAATWLKGADQKGLNYASKALRVTLAETEPEKRD